MFIRLKLLVFVSLTFLASSVFSQDTNFDIDDTNDMGKLPSCGTWGSLNARVRSCSNQRPNRFDSFVLVTRTKRGKEIYLDTMNRILWSDQLHEDWILVRDWMHTPQKLTYAEATKACRKDLDEMGKIPLDWALPLVEEIQLGLKAGLGQIPRMKGTFWSLNLVYQYPHAMIYSNKNESIRMKPQIERHSVRCVAKID